MDPVRIKPPLMSGIFTRMGIYLIAGVFFIIGITVSPNFLTRQNILNIFWGVSILGLVACGMGFVTYSGHFADLSVPAIVAFSGNIAISFLKMGLFPALLLGLAAGMIIGVLNGVIVGYLRANPILWTIAVQIFMEGLQRFLWGNLQIYPDSEPGTPGSIFIRLFGMSVLGIPIPIIIMIVLFVIFQVVMKRTKFGMQTKLIGSSYLAAKYSGINVRGTVFFVFLISSFTSSIAGIFMSSMSGIGAFYLGEGYDFRALTAIVIGGVMLNGGMGNMIGVLGGVLTIGIIVNIMTFLSMKFYQQNIVTGLIFIIVVWVNTGLQRKKGRIGE